MIQDTIAAPASATGGAISVIRVSGNDAIPMASSIFTPAEGASPLSESRGYTLHFGQVHLTDGTLLDEVVVALFRAPASYTGEDSVEIYCHGSNYIVQTMLALLIEKGARMATAGEFTRRAFVNGKMDLAQAEAVADLIASETESAHRVAMSQMKGGFSRELRQMRDEMLHIVSLMELELDFSEEEVEFADRGELGKLLDTTIDHIDTLVASFRLGNVIKNGIPVAIAGATNTGKSTLLNAILGEEKAIVSPIHGTTRDAIEDTINIEGTLFRFIDTAGIRKTRGTVETIGIEKTFEKIRQASIILLMLDARRPDNFTESIANFAGKFDSSRQKVVILINKCDKLAGSTTPALPLMRECAASTANEAGISPVAVLTISAREKTGMAELRRTLVKIVESLNFDLDATLVTNLRHYQSLRSALASLMQARTDLDTAKPTDLIAQDIREALYHIGAITGQISTDEILGEIFGKFCIGK